MGIKLSHFIGESASECSDEDNLLSESTLEVADKQVGVERAVILPDQKEYPLLHKLLSLNPYTKIDALVSAVAKLHGNKSIAYRNKLPKFGRRIISISLSPVLRSLILYLWLQKIANHLTTMLQSAY
jgi:hypothetical protein